MNGAQALIRTLTGAGVEVCFSNPGTSEMHFVAALDTVPQMRGVLCLFEGAATGAADGYGRMTGRPAAALLHLGPGLANGLANLHNARRAGTPLVNVVGDHATFHKRLDAPLESDIDALAGSVSGWVRRSLRSADVAGDAAEAVAAASAGAIATLGRGRVPGPAGPRAGIRRQRDVHDLGAVDARPPGARRHHGDLQQPVLRHPGHGAGTGRRGPGGRGRGRGAEPAGPDPPHPGLHRAGRRDGRARGAGHQAAEFAAGLRQALAEPGPHLIEAVLP